MIERLERMPRKLTAAAAAAIGALGLSACGGSGSVSRAEWDIRVECPATSDVLAVTSVDNPDGYFDAGKVNVECRSADAVSTPPQSMEVISGPNAGEVNIVPELPKDPGVFTVRVATNYDNGGMGYDYSPPSVDTSTVSGAITLDYDGGYSSRPEKNVITAAKIQ